MFPRWLVSSLLGLSLLAAVLWLTWPRASVPPDWVPVALRLNGLSEVAHQESLDKLNAMPKLKSELRRALRGENRNLALDVISTLRMADLLPDLMEASTRDDSGFTYLTIGALVTADNLQSTSELFHTRLIAAPTSPTARMILLDTLGRMRYRLDPTELAALLFREPSPEVRSSALYYLRHFLVTLHEPKYLPLLRHFLELDEVSYQSRLQALFLTSELPQDLLKDLAGADIHCPKDSPRRLRALCDRLRE